MPSCRYPCGRASSTRRGRTVRDQLLAVAVENFTNRRAALAMDIGELAAGEYVLSLDASMEMQKASRVLRFAVQ
jgi:hypothetical protein